MANSAESRPRCVVLVGNPNTGKSTLFNALSGLSQHVGNYPGVTVEKKTGRFRIDGQEHFLVDLPGTYSLAPRSPDEMVTVDILLGRRQNVPPPDLILCVVDASNLERNLYVVSQFLELLFRCGQRAPIDAAFAGFALLASQLFGGLYLHDRLAFAQGLVMKPLLGIIGGTQRTSIAVSSRS